MRAAFFALCVAAFATTAHADMIASNGNDRVRLTDKPCTTAKVLEMINPILHSRVRQASATVGAKSYLACWMVLGEHAALLYEDGDQGRIPLRDFKPAPGV